MFMRKPQNKRFEYTPRFYDPKKDEKALRRRQIKFESNVRRGSTRPLIIIVIMFILVYLIYTYFG
ncbi:MAG: hypothetical protein IH600_03730 [Bacteroidetes bacterium]|nr:hypothetical protein [Bacteroidota bacterium]